MKDAISIEVTYALPEKQTLLSISVSKGTTVQQAIQQSGILDMHKDINIETNKVGIWYKTVKLDTQLNDGDRVEIYRPLIADPKEIRKRRAEQAKQAGKVNKVTGAKIK